MAWLGGLLLEPQRMLLREYLERWLKDDAAASLRATTLDSYERLLRCHVLPHLGDVPLSKISPAHVQALCTRLAKAGVSPRKCQYVHAMLRRALQRAVQWELIVRNPCAAVARPRAARKEIQPLTPEGSRKLLEAAMGDSLEAPKQPRPAQFPPRDAPPIEALQPQQRNPAV